MTSNVQTRVAATYSAHPVRRYFEYGITVALCTDNRLMSGVTLTDEYRHARDELGFSGEELVRVARMAFESADRPDLYSRSREERGLEPEQMVVDSDDELDPGLGHG